MGKRAVVGVWSERPSGSLGAEGRPGSRKYLEQLLEGSAQFAPFLPGALGVTSAAGKQVLDAGCGPGVELVRFARAGAEVTGIDLVAEHTAQARRHLQAAGLAGEVVHGDVEALPFRDGSFDRVVSVNALQFTPDPARAVREIKRVLRPGGAFVLVVYNRHSFRLWRAALKSALLGRPRSLDATAASTLGWAEQTDIQIRTYSRRQLRALLKDFSQVRVRACRYTGDRRPGWYLVASAHTSATTG